MMSKYLLFLLALVYGFANAEILRNGLQNLRGTSIERCINCICYSKTGTSDMYKCGRQLITFFHWRNAGSLTPTSSWRPVAGFISCRNDVNCIVNTIKRHTEQYGRIDCNLDGQFDCEDRFAIQRFKSNCVNRRFGPLIFSRFQSCLPNVLNPEGESNEDGGSYGDCEGTC